MGGRAWAIQGAGMTNLDEFSDEGLVKMIQRSRLIRGCIALRAT